MLFEKPQQHVVHGWYVAQKNNGMYYLHSDGVVRSSTYNGKTGQASGYYETELAAYKAIFNYLDNSVVDYCIISTLEE